MSKYNVDKLVGVKTQDANAMLYICIANELAETNRLKRLELQDRLKGANESVDWDLSDNA